MACQVVLDEPAEGVNRRATGEKETFEPDKQRYRLADVVQTRPRNHSENALTSASPRSPPPNLTPFMIECRPTGKAPAPELPSTLPTFLLTVRQSSQTSHVYLGPDFIVPLAHKLHRSTRAGISECGHTLSRHRFVTWLTAATMFLALELSPQPETAKGHSRSPSCPGTCHAGVSFVSDVISVLLPTRERTQTTRPLARKGRSPMCMSTSFRPNGLPAVAPCLSGRLPGCHGAGVATG